MNIEQKLNKEISMIFKTSRQKPQSGAGKSTVTYDEMLSDKMLIIQIIRTGIPYSLFSLIKNVTPFTESDWATFLDMSTKSLQRYKQESKNFKSIHSEKIIEMAEVTDFGTKVFGDLEKFKLWLNTPNFALGNVKPVELLRDSYGKEMVIGELNRIEHGIFV